MVRSGLAPNGEETLPTAPYLVSKCKCGLFEGHEDCDFVERKLCRGGSSQWMQGNESVGIHSPC